MNTIDTIKNRIAILYKANPNIHVNVSLGSPRTKKTKLYNQPAVIKGVYPNVFQIEEMTSGISKRHTHQYVDVLTKNIEILELDDQ